MLYKNNIYTNLYKYVTAKNNKHKESQYNIIYTILKNNGFSDKKISSALSSQDKSDNEISKLCQVSGIFGISVIDAFIQAYKIEMIMTKLTIPSGGTIFEPHIATRANMMLVYFTKAIKIQNKHKQILKQSAFVVDFYKVDIYLKMQNSNNPNHIKHLHNCLYKHSLPKGYVSSYTYKRFWSKILKDSYSDYHKKLFAKADQIEKYLSLKLSPKESIVNDAISHADSQESPRNGIIEILREMGAFGKDPYDPKKVVEKAFAIKLFGLENYKKFPALADVAIRYHPYFTNLLQNAFTTDHLKTAIELEKKAKTHDKLPDFIVNIDNKYFLKKLPPNDSQKYLLGQLTHCCQTLGSHTEKVISDGVQLEHNGFYVLLEKKSKNADPLVKNQPINWGQYKAIAQSYAWLGKKQGLVFDSIERIDPSVDNIIYSLFDKFGKEVIKNTDITKIYVGFGGTPYNMHIGNKESNLQEMIEGRQSPDSTEQYLIHENPLEYLHSIKAPSELINAKEIENMNFLTLKLLTTRPVLEAHTNKLFTFKDLLQVSSEKKLQLLISPTALRSYKDELFTFKELLKIHNANKLELLISQMALECYKIGAVAFKDLKDLNLDEIKLFTSKYAFKFYQSGAGTFEDLTSFNVKKIQLLLSDNALKCYQAEAGTFQDLAKFDVKKILLLLSENALQYYQAEAGTFQDLAKFDVKKIQLLLSEFNVETIQILLSDNALKCYQAGAGTFQDLIGLDLKTIQILISESALKCYQVGVGTFQDLIIFDVTTIHIFLSDNALKCYQAGVGTFQDLTKLDVKTIHILLSDNALKCYQAGAGTFQDLTKLDVKKIQLLLSENALQYYQAEAGTFQDLTKFDAKTAEILLSDNALKCYQVGAGTLQDLTSLDVKKIQLLLSDNALKCYQVRAGTFQDLISFNVKKIQLLLSDNALKCYQAEPGIFQNSKGWNRYDKMLLSRTAQFQDFKDLNIDKIHLLTSPQALSFYQIQTDTFPYLKSLDVSTIEAAISEKAVQCYQAGAGTPQDLTNFDVKKTQLLLSDNALQYYQNNKGKFDDYLHSCINTIDALSTTMLIVEHSVSLMPECIIEAYRNYSSIDIKYLQYGTELILGCYATYKYHTYNFNIYYLPASRAIAFSITDAVTNHFASTMYSGIKEFFHNIIQEDEVKYISKLCVGITIGQLSDNPKTTTAVSIISSTQDYLVSPSKEGLDDGIAKMVGALFAFIVVYKSAPSPTYYQYASAMIVGAYVGKFLQDVQDILTALTNNNNDNKDNTMSGVYDDENILEECHSSSTAGGIHYPECENEI